MLYFGDACPVVVRHLWKVWIGVRMRSHLDFDRVAAGTIDRFVLGSRAGGAIGALDWCLGARDAPGRLVVVNVWNSVVWEAAEILHLGGILQCSFHCPKLWHLWH